MCKNNNNKHASKRNAGLSIDKFNALQITPLGEQTKNKKKKALPGGMGQINEGIKGVGNLGRKNKQRQ